MFYAINKYCKILMVANYTNTEINELFSNCLPNPSVIGLMVKRINNPIMIVAFSCKRVLRKPVSEVNNINLIITCIFILNNKNDVSLVIYLLILRKLFLNLVLQTLYVILFIICHD